MKKQTAMALAAVFAMSVAGTALAAPANPFVDVPAKHWAYDSINKLAQAGVISGYGDGTFKGDKTLTRYEVAVLVGKAMANSDKADAEAKKTIEALKAEFGSELNNLGVRVDNLEKNASKIKFTGEVRERYEYSKDATPDKTGLIDKSTSKTRLRLYMTAPVADNVTFKGRLASESEWGNSNTGTNEVRLDQAYITGTVGGVTYSFGRQPVALGQKLLISNTANNDGLFVTAGKDLKVTAGAFKYKDANYTAGNVAFKLGKNVNFTASYLGDDQGTTTYDSTAAGFNYTGWKNFTVSGEYGQNDSDVAKNANSGDKAKAWVSRIKYQGAKPDKVHSFGLYTSYRSADAKFDTLGFNDFTDTVGWVSGITEMDNVKGMDYGFEYTLFKNGILHLQYNDLKQKEGTADKKNYIAELTYTF